MKVFNGCRVRWVAAIALWIIVACGLTLFAQTNAENPGLHVTRSLSAVHALPESTFQVTLELKADTDLNGVGLRETLPFGWIIHPVENAGAAFKRSEAEWVFNETIEAGTRRFVTYELTVPAARQLLSDPLPQCFTISGTYQTTVPSYETAIEGESTIEVVSELPIGTAIAHLIPQQVIGVDTIDLRLSRWISEAQLERALEFWQHDLPVPGTGGQRIDLAMINHLAAQFETCTRADDALPLSINPELQAVRTLDTFLPCDTVLLPEGCLDPGQAARLVTVTLQITPSYDAYGVGLKEWFPSAWKVTLVDQDGFWYRPSAREWVYPTRVRAGETLELTYQIEVVPTAFDSVVADAGCCGQGMTIVGEASAALECSAAPVLGEDTVTVNSCIPVLLAISRWDVRNDRLDVKLSDTISFSQVQKAVQFWEQNLPVPHTCGYTVGYHTLKSIVAYWLSATPVTLPLSQDVALPACGNSAEDCASATCIEGWICQLADMQNPEDFVGLPKPPTVIVDGGPDRVLTCAQPSVTLDAVTTGGIEPFKYEWRDSSGNTLSTARTLSVDIPGTYTLIAISCGGCLAIDTIDITEDFAQPRVDAAVSDILTGVVTVVDISATVSGGTAPFTIVWTDPLGEPIGNALALSVSQPGMYSVTVTGANGCRDTASVLVLQDIEPPSVQIDIAPAPIVHTEPSDAVLTCALPNVVLEGQVSGGREPYVLQWTNGQGAVLGNASTLDVSIPETYKLTVTGANGISASTNVTVGQDIAPPSVTVVASGELTCAVTEVSLTTSVTDGRPPFTYQWTNAMGETVGSDSVCAVTNPGTYTVVVMGTNGCSDRASLIVGQNIEPPIVVPSVTGVLTCSVSEVTASVSVSGGRPPYTITWKDSVGQSIGETVDISVSVPGAYTALVVGANGCRTETTLIVEEDIEPPVVTASVDGILTCALTSVNLHANVVGGRAPLTFRWMNEAGQTVGTSVGLSVTTPGIYTIQVTGANGCLSSDRIIVAQDTEAPAVAVAASESLTCSVTEVQLTATVSGGRAPYLYEWKSPGGIVVGQSPILTVSTPGTYTVAVTGTNGCKSMASIAVLQDIEPPAIAIPTPDQLTCALTNVVLTADVSGGQAPYTFVWMDASNYVIGQSETVTVSSPGPYTVQVTGANGCQSIARTTVCQDLEPPVVAIPVPEVLTCAVTEVTLSATTAGGRMPYTYSWVNGTGQVIGSEVQLAVANAGIYSVTVTGANGCAASASITVQQDIAPPVVTIPAPGVLTCSVPCVTLTSCVSDGRAPYTYAWSDSAGQIIGSNSALGVTEPGTYTLSVTGANGCASSVQVVVQQDTTPPCVLLCETRTLTCDQPTVFVDAEVCDGRAPFTYVWTDDCGAIIATTEDVTLGFAGIYTLTVTGANGCSTSRSVRIINGINPPIVDAGPDQMLACAGDEVVLDATVSGGSFPYTYVWVDSCGDIVGTCEDLVVSIAGTYILTVQSADGCVAMDSVIVGLP